MRLLAAAVLLLALAGCGGPAVYAGITFGLNAVDKGFGITNGAVELFRQVKPDPPPEKPPP